MPSAPLISAYAAAYGFQGWIFRFVSILGERYTHGHVYDFYRALKRDPTFVDIEDHIWHLIEEEADRLGMLAEATEA